MWFIAPVLALLAALGMVAARSRRHTKPKTGGAPAASTHEQGEGGP